MGRQPRDESPGFHHVVTRGNNKRRIFEDDADRRLFCSLVDRVAQKNEWDILAYVLMGNHYHLLMKVGACGVSAGMQRINQTHAITFNIRHRRINHLFGKRFWSRHLTTDASLQAAARYIVQNPRRAGQVHDLQEYTWSSYRATIGVEFAPIRLAKDELLSFFGRTPAQGIRSYRDFCEEPPLRTELE